MKILKLLLDYSINVIFKNSFFISKFSILNKKFFFLGFYILFKFLFFMVSQNIFLKKKIFIYKKYVYKIYERTSSIFR